MSIEGLPNLSKWKDRLAARPACRRGIERPPVTVKSKDVNQSGTAKFIEEARKMLETGANTQK